MTKKKSVFDTPYYDEEERELMKAMEEDEIKSLPKKEVIKLKKQLKEAAENSSLLRRKDKNVSIRTSGLVISKIKEKAAKHGLPYQTLIGIILHKYADGQIEIEL